MRVSLRAGEKIYVNGAVLSVDRKVSLELLNDVTFLLEAHVMQASDATTPLRQIYFAIQLMLMEPGSAERIRTSAEEMFSSFEQAAQGSVLAGLSHEAHAKFQAGRFIEALKALRATFAREAEHISKPALAGASIQPEGAIRCR
jgi:flagellar biosynthesis repressor protein FlbT